MREVGNTKNLVPSIFLCLILSGEKKHVLAELCIFYYIFVRRIQIFQNRYSVYFRASFQGSAADPSRFFFFRILRCEGQCSVQLCAEAFSEIYILLED